MTEPWIWSYSFYDEKEQKTREALCTLGNGHFTSRGAFEESHPDGIHYPGTYLMGGYNRLESVVHGRRIENEDLVNWPNWLTLTFKIADSDPFDIKKVQLLEFKQELDMRLGVLKRSIRFEDERLRRSRIATSRLVSMRHKNLAALRWELIPENWADTITIISGIDGSVKNRGVARYRDLNSLHLVPLNFEQMDSNSILFQSRSSQSRIEVSQALKTKVIGGKLKKITARQSEQHFKNGKVLQFFEVQAIPDKPIRVEKHLTFFTSREMAISESSLEAKVALKRFPGFKKLLSEQQAAWSRLWWRCATELPDCPETEQILRLHLFHLLQTVNLNSIDIDAGLPARGLHGEAYRGHVFWDEIFIQPLLNFTIPQVSRALLLYRYRRLPEAIRAAKNQGLKGALFPWQSGSNGREESQKIHLNPVSQRWLPDHTYLQRHINCAIAYNVYQYYQASGDTDFLLDYGFELLLQISRCLASLCSFNVARKRFEILGVVGPDEYHTAYPSSSQAGINNNAYTNVMVAWCLIKTRELLGHVCSWRKSELLSRFDFTARELERWEDISRQMFIPFLEGQIISQFEGYGELKELDWEAYRRRYGDIQRLDRILEAENDSSNNYKICKQADVLMLFYLLSEAELEEIFHQCGYELSADIAIRENLEYYDKRSSHGSTLSRVVHSWVMARNDRKNAWQLFNQALLSDVKDVQGGTTSEGIHLGAMAGTVDLLRRCFTGMKARGDTLYFDPKLPESCSRLLYRVRFRGAWLSVNLNKKELKVDRIPLDGAAASAIKISFREKVLGFDLTNRVTFKIT